MLIIRMRSSLLVSAAWLVVASPAYAQGLPPLPPPPGGDNALPPLPGLDEPSAPANDLPPLPSPSDADADEINEIQALFDEVPPLPPENAEASATLEPGQAGSAPAADTPLALGDDLPPIEIPKQEDDADFSLFSFDEKPAGEAPALPPLPTQEKNEEETLAPEEEPNLTIDPVPKFKPSIPGRYKNYQQQPHSPYASPSQASVYTAYHQQLFNAIARGDQRAVHAFVSNGIGLEARNQQGETPLLHALRYQQLPMVYMLLQAGADPNVRGANGMSPLHIAAYMGRSDLAYAFLAAEADPNITDTSGMTPLMYAVSQQKSDLVDMLLQYGAEVDRATADGKTALHIAASQGFQAMAEKLLNHGADKMKQDQHGYSPADYARYYNHVGLANMLAPPLPAAPTYNPYQYQQPYGGYYQQPSPYQYPAQPAYPQPQYQQPYYSR